MLDPVAQKAQNAASGTWKLVDSNGDGSLDQYEFFACFVLACNNGGYAIPQFTVSSQVFQ